MATERYSRAVHANYDLLPSQSRDYRAKELVQLTLLKVPHPTIAMALFFNHFALHPKPYPSPRSPLGWPYGQ